jgi:hypothetical protein
VVLQPLRLLNIPQMGKLGNQNSAGRAIRTENCLAGYFVSRLEKTH